MIRDPWKQALATLSDAPGIQGALLVTRDGLCVINECPKISRPGTMSALAAAVMAAGETMVGELGGRSPVILRLEAEGVSLIAVAAATDLMLVAVAEPNADLKQTFAHVRKAIEHSKENGG
ncbi:MAG TPA: roadblock/LC7 domain-containing protein [Candidatus Thermoplasmatota archaeon]|nr:roadblock/LC7 domain-containing protein [Candidatus Thermoplasmatota archaeon]